MRMPPWTVRIACHNHQTRSVAEVQRFDASMRQHQVYIYTRIYIYIYIYMWRDVNENVDLIH